MGTSSGMDRLVLVYTCTEALNVALLSEVLYAHIRSAWRGEKLVLPT